MIRSLFFFEEGYRSIRVARFLKSLTNIKIYFISNNFSATFVIRYLWISTLVFGSFVRLFCYMLPSHHILEIFYVISNEILCEQITMKILTHSNDARCWKFLYFWYLQWTSNLHASLFTPSRKLLSVNESDRGHKINQRVIENAWHSIKYKNYTIKKQKNRYKFRWQPKKMLKPPPNQLAYNGRAISKSDFSFTHMKKSRTAGRVRQHTEPKAFRQRINSTRFLFFLIWIFFSTTLTKEIWEIKNMVRQRAKKGRKVGEAVAQRENCVEVEKSVH